MHLVVACALLAVVLVVAAARPRGLSEAVAAVPAALLVLAVGATTWGHARDEVERLGPVVGFLAAVLVLSHCCDVEGLFVAAGRVMTRHARGSATRLLTAGFVVAAATTAVLSLDTTVVLLTPVALAAVTRAGVAPRPHLYATTHLANSASLLLPVSNLTNLLAVAVAPVSFPRFAALMVLPWLVAVGVELVGFRWFFRADLRPAAVPPAARAHDVDRADVPVVAVAVVAATLVGFVVASLLDVPPVWPATAGAVVMAVRLLLARRTTLRTVVASAAPLFCLFVLALAVVVRAASDAGLAAAVRHMLPTGASLPALLGVAVVAAVAANLVNNLPATLLLMPVAARGGVGPVLAVLVGVDIGPNLTYVGSLATLLWRRLLPRRLGVPTLREFSALGLVTVPGAVVAATLALWLSLRVVGAG